ncbi:Phosphate-specific transport system accessory protein PhoU [Fundidesulfovibrio magnetotacticus]|uniref:Phosphate-specific transport system accessory protein PhoU n=1 Tax=Fundidesulfovibrio magnetotacticus TaxID=2730080 RepID=A0A6V8LKH9_9BACT|nr:phosphate signaling complex protein PhoU [Fundidesulfovibrio magnetotacticus]GFK93203.1 Phosphate-specific transport system accessory protein PhoU [Fundidesulfovibrio magnetotacticus]
MHNEFDDELLRLRVLMGEMTARAGESLEKALRSVRERQAAPAQECMDNDDVVDSLECRAERLCLRLLALRQPVARDLRLLVGSMRVASNLERIADEAVNIAERSLVLLESPAHADTPALWTMTGACLELYAATRRAWTEGSAELASAVRKENLAVHGLHVKAFRELSALMVAGPEAMERSMQLSFVAYSVKRVCDRCANVAESVGFIVDGRDLKHAGCAGA